LPRAFLQPGQRVLGVSPTFHSVYEFATGCKADSIQLPLTDNHEQDIPGLVAAANKPDANVGFLYLCNPNNPTGMVVPKDQVAQLLDGAPRGLPVLVDEAYHDFVDDPAYESAIAHVVADRPVVVARTFSKVYGLAGVRLGYAIAPPQLIARMNQHAGDMSVSALAKWAGVAALTDRASYDRVRLNLIQSRNATTARLDKAGYATLPSGGNFFMVDLRRPVGPVITAFRDRGILVGRPFPPMNEHLRVSIGTPEDMQKFIAAFNDILGAAA
jgi:histidinol-phosphate aminotransferase